MGTDCCTFRGQCGQLPFGVFLSMWNRKYKCIFENDEKLKKLKKYYVFLNLQLSWTNQCKLSLSVLL